MYRPAYPFINYMYFISHINAGENVRVPDFVFLAHVVDVTASMHPPFVFRSLASLPYSPKLFLLPFWPLAFSAMFALWAWSKTFLISFYWLRGRLHQTWAVPRYGFQVYAVTRLSFSNITKSTIKHTCFVFANILPAFYLFNFFFLKKQM